MKIIAIYQNANPKVGIKAIVLDTVEPFEANKASPLVHVISSSVRKVLNKPATLLRKTGTGDMNILGKAMNLPIVTYGPGDSHLDHTSMNTSKSKNTSTPSLSTKKRCCDYQSCITAKTETPKQTETTKLNLSFSLFASGIISVAFSFRSILNFFMPLFIVLLAFFNSDKHPFVFFVDASAKQSLSCHVQILPEQWCPVLISVSSISSLVWGKN